MSAPQALCYLLGLSDLMPKEMSPKERRLFEASIVAQAVRELTYFFQSKHTDHGRLTRKDPMTAPTSVLPKEIILDLIECGDYTLTGIGHCTGIHEDAIQDVVSGLNVSPSLVLFYRLAELHQVARKELYERVKRAILLSIFQKNHAEMPFSEGMMQAV